MSMQTENICGKLSFSNPAPLRAVSASHLASTLRPSRHPIAHCGAPLPSTRSRARAWTCDSHEHMCSRSSNMLHVLLTCRNSSHCARLQKCPNRVVAQPRTRTRNLVNKLDGQGFCRAQAALHVPPRWHHATDLHHGDDVVLCIAMKTHGTQGVLGYLQSRYDLQDANIKVRGTCVDKLQSTCNWNAATAHEHLPHLPTAGKHKQTKTIVLHAHADDYRIHCALQHRAL
jgi:hypothetical protein